MTRSCVCSFQIRDIITFVYLWNYIAHRCSHCSVFLGYHFLRASYSKQNSWVTSNGYACRSEVCDCLILTVFFFSIFLAQMHALALKDKEEEHAGMLHTAGEIQVCFFSKSCCRNRVFFSFFKSGKQSF